MAGVGQDSSVVDRQSLLFSYAELPRLSRFGQLSSGGLSGLISVDLV